MNRPLALLRAPSGISGDLFFQKSFPNHLPDQVTQKELADGTTIFHIRSARGLVSLAEQALQALVKTSGGKGLHLVLFIKRTHDWGSMRAYSKAVAREVAALNPNQMIITSSKEKRKGTVFIDWMRNGEGSTCIAPWSLRARDGAAVSMPIYWSDLATAKADGFTLQQPLRPPDEWIEPEPQLIPKGLLRRLTGKNDG